MAKAQEVMVKDVEGNWYVVNKETLRQKVDPETALAALATERNQKREKIIDMLKLMDPMDRAILRDMIMGSGGPVSLPPWVQDMPGETFLDSSPIDSPPPPPPNDIATTVGMGFPWWQWQVNPYWRSSPYASWRMGLEMARQRYRNW